MNPNVLLMDPFLNANVVQGILVVFVIQQHVRRNRVKMMRRVPLLVPTIAALVRTAILEQIVKSPHVPVVHVTWTMS